MNTQINFLTTGINVREISQDEQLIVNGGGGVCYRNPSGQPNPERYFMKDSGLTILQVWDNRKYRNTWYGYQFTRAEFIRHCANQGFPYIRTW